MPSFSFIRGPVDKRGSFIVILFGEIGSKKESGPWAAGVMEMGRLKLEGGM